MLSSCVFANQNLRRPSRSLHFPLSLFDFPFPPKLLRPLPLRAPKSRRINTYKSLSKQRTLTIFRMIDLQKNRGEGAHPSSQELCALFASCSSPLPMFRRSNVPTFRRVSSRPLFSFAYKCPLPQPLSLHTLTNARGCGGLLVISRRSFRSLHQECFTTLSQSSASKLFLKTA